MTCQQLVELVTKYLDGTLSWRDRRRFEKHVGACEWCARYIEQMRMTIRTVGHLDVDSISRALGPSCWPRSATGTAASDLFPHRRNDLGARRSISCAPPGEKMKLSNPSSVAKSAICSGAAAHRGSGCRCDGSAPGRGPPPERLVDALHRFRRLLGRQVGLRRDPAVPKRTRDAQHPRLVAPIQIPIGCAGGGPSNLPSAFQKSRISTIACSSASTD